MSIRLEFQEVPNLDRYYIRGRNAEGVWVDRYGFETPVRELSSSHLQNIERLLRKWARQDYIMALVDGMVPLPADAGAPAAGVAIALHAHPFWEHLIKEQERRRKKPGIVRAFVRCLFHRS